MNPVALRSRPPGTVRPRQTHPREVLAAVVLSLGGVLASALATPSVALGADELPSCRYDDVATPQATYDEWQTTLLDTSLQLPASYVPPDLVPVSLAGIGGSGSVRAVVIDDLRAMARAARVAGSPIAVESAYRSFASQVAVLRRWIGAAGDASGMLHAARPGHSEHQLGVAIDFRSAGPGSTTVGDWGQTRAGTWMRLHAWQYGFIQSYPNGQQSRTCYAYEAWHFRYVGRALAASVHRSGLTLREFLWTHSADAAFQVGAIAWPRRSAPPDAAGTIPFDAGPALTTADPTTVTTAGPSSNAATSPAATQTGQPRPLAGAGSSLAAVTLANPDWRPAIGLVVIVTLILALVVSTRGRRAAGGR